MPIINYHNTFVSQREIDRWKNQQIYHSKQSIPMYSCYFSMYNCYFYSESDHILEYTINFDYNDNTLYMVYAIDDCGFDEHRYICDYNKEKVLYKKLENILVDKLKNYHHEKVRYTKNYIMNFPHITKEIIVKTFGL
jgi:hypothetical protein